MRGEKVSVEPYLEQGVWADGRGGSTYERYVVTSPRRSVVAMAGVPVGGSGFLLSAMPRVGDLGYSTASGQRPRRGWDVFPIPGRCATR